jgi:alpha-beta hydrolase superfamily lysophospholipase
MPARSQVARIWLLGAVLGLAVPAGAAERQVVTFETFDGEVIHGDYYACKATETAVPMVILLHMYRSDRTAFAPLIEPLHEAGFAVLALDLRGHGESAREKTRARVMAAETAVFEEMYEDVRAAYDWLVKQEDIDRSRFALVGASIGCSIALDYAVEDRSVDVIVCLSPGTGYLGLDSKADMRNLKGRKIWLLGARNAKEEQAIETLKALGAGVEAELVAGDHHGTHMFGQVPEIEKRIADYLKKHVGGPTQTTVYGSIRSAIYHLPGSGWIERIKPWNLRHYSSAAEAESRGLRAAKSRGPDDRPSRKQNP